MKRMMATIASAALLGGCSFFTPKPPPEIAAPPADANSTPQELAGWWVSTAALGPGSDCVRKVEMTFERGGAYSGTMLIEADQKKQFGHLDGTWRTEAGKLTVTFADGRARIWAVAWEGTMLVLKDGDAELRLERMSE